MVDSEDDVDIDNEAWPADEAGRLFECLWENNIKVAFYAEQSITHPIKGLYKNASKCSLSQYIWINLHSGGYGKWEYGRLIIIIILN